jgi:hypothetical protein
MKFLSVRPYPTTRPVHTGAITEDTTAKVLTGVIIGSALLMFLFVSV